MKQFEMVAHVKVDEAIRAGLESQAIHRALSESQAAAAPAPPAAARAIVERIFAWLLELLGMARLALQPAKQPKPPVAPPSQRN